jgi:crotonobetainyl-CoA:carnitine CoA-transferase CaiB-like acyl-CoA transferase
MQRSQKEWCKVFDGTDACVTPVLSPQQLHEHPLHVARLAIKLEKLQHKRDAAALQGNICAGQHGRHPGARSS